MNIFTLSEAATNSVPCESKKSSKWLYDAGTHRTCSMTESTSIDSFGFTIKSNRDETITGLDLESNKNILFLPIRVDRSFAKLVAYNANGCSLKSLSKENFKNLRFLKHLWLGENEIVKIYSDTFVDLSSLVDLALCKKINREILLPVF